MGYGHIDSNLVKPTDYRGEVSTIPTGHSGKIDFDYGSNARLNSEEINKLNTQINERGEIIDKLQEEIKAKEEQINNLTTDQKDTKERYENELSSLKAQLKTNEIDLTNLKSNHQEELKILKLKIASRQRVIRNILIFGGIGIAIISGILLYISSLVSKKPNIPDNESTSDSEQIISKKKNVPKPNKDFSNWWWLLILILLCIFVIVWLLNRN